MMVYGMVCKKVLNTICVLAFAGAAQAATIDLGSKDLKLDLELASSTSLSISDNAEIDLGFLIIPGFFQALDFTANPALELNTGDGVNFNLSVTPGFTGISTETAREGDRQLELLFGTEWFARLILADGDNLDNVLTGASFGDASLTVWDVTSIPLPASLSLLLVGLGCFAVMKRKKVYGMNSRTPSVRSSILDIDKV